MDDHQYHSLCDLLKHTYGDVFPKVWGRIIATRDTEILERFLCFAIDTPQLTDTVFSHTGAERLLWANWPEGWNLFCQKAVHTSSVSCKALVEKAVSNPFSFQVLVDLVVDQAGKKQAKDLSDDTHLQNNLEAVAYGAVLTNNPTLYGFCADPKWWGTLLPLPYNSNQVYEQALSLNHMWVLKRLMSDHKDHIWGMTALRDLKTIAPFDQLKDLHDFMQDKFDGYYTPTVLLCEIIASTNRLWSKETFEWCCVQRARLSQHPAPSVSLTGSNREFWEMTLVLGSDEQISFEQVMAVGHELWNETASPEKFIAHLVAQFSPHDIIPSVLRNLSQNTPQRYHQAIVNLPHNILIQRNIDDLIGAIDENTDHALAHCSVSTDRLDQWRQSYQQKRVLLATIEQPTQSQRRKM